MTPDTEPAGATASLGKKPRFAYLLATCFGLGYLPKAPGTWGSLAGVILTSAIWVATLQGFISDVFFHDLFAPAYALVTNVCLVLVAVAGVWASSRVVAFSGIKDPQFVVIDEVSGQMLALQLGIPALAGRRFFVIHTPILNFDVQWAVLLVGFILFRLFDIWKPFPIRHLEKLPGGWGVMADDWLAGIYAAILLRLALHFNLL